jgi:type IV pilus assembly protein PilY1
MAQAGGFIADNTNYTADSIYAGDLNGQLWRFDLTNLSASSNQTATLLAKLTDANGQPQPITAAPLIEIDPATSRRFVLVGTGQLLDFADVDSTQVQSFYAIIDGTTYAFNPITKTITRQDLAQQTDATTPVVLSGKQGWYMDLNGINLKYEPDGSKQQATTSATGERIINIPSSSFNGQVSFGTTFMTTDSCLPTAGDTYTNNFGTGTTGLNNGQLYIQDTGSVNGVEYATDANGNVILVQTDSQGNTTIIPLPETAGATTRLLNWRNVPVSGN